MPLSRFSTEFFDNTSFDKKERLAQTAEKKKADLAQIAGPDPYDLPIIDSVIQQNTVRESAHRDRSGGELTGDALLGMSRFVSDVGFNLAATLSPVGTGSILDAGESVNQWLTDRTSDISQLNAQRLAQDQARDQAENQRRYEEESGGQDLWGAFNREFRNLRDTLGNYWDNPTATFDLVTSQAPTLGLGRAASIASRAHRLRRIDRAGRGLAPVGGATKDQLFNRYLGAGVAAMEAPGVYAENYRDIMDAPLEELIERFPDQAEALSRDVDGSVRESLANRSAYIGTAIQAPAAYAASRLGAPFQRDPLGISAQTGAAAVRQRGRQGLLDAVQDVGGEILEESTQAVTGTLAGAAGRALSGEENIDYLEGIGAGVGEGIVGAAGLSGTLRAPATAVAAAQATIAAPFRARLDRIKEENEQAQQEGLAKEVADVSNRAVDVAAVNETLPEELKFVPESDVAEFQTEAIETPEEVPTKSADRLMSLSQVLSRFSEIEDDAERIGMSFFTARTSREMREHLNRVIEPAIRETKDEATKEALTNYRQQVTRLLDSDLVRQIENTVSEINEAELDRIFQSVPEPAAVSEALSEVSPPEPQVARAIEQVVDLAHKAPEKVTRQVAQRVLAHSRNMNPDSPKWKAVRAAEKFAEARESYSARKERIDAINPKTKTLDIVTQEITNDGFDRGGKKLPSISQHVSNITDAMGKGDMETAREAFRSFSHFVEHMRRKAKVIDAEAMRQFKAGRPDTKVAVDYNTKDAQGNKKNLKAYVNIGFKGGEQFVDAVVSDSDLVTDAYNSLIESYPELVRTPRPLAPLGQPRWRSAEATQESSATPSQAPAQNVVEETTEVADARTDDRPAEDPTPRATTPRGSDLNKWTIDQLQDELAKTKNPKAREKIEKHLRNRIETEAKQERAESVDTSELTPDDMLTQRRRQELRDLPPLLSQWTDEQLAREGMYAAWRHKEGKHHNSEKPLNKILAEIDRREDARTRPKHKSVRDRFNTVLENLGLDDGLDSENLFIRSFRPRPRSNSLFARFAEPLKAFRDAITNKDISPILVRRDKHLEWNNREIGQLDRIANEFVPKIVHQLNENLRKSGQTPVKNGKNNWRYHNRLSLHLTNGDPENLTYDQKAAEAAALAGIQWALDHINIPPDHDVDKMEQRMFHDGVPENIRELLNDFHNFDNTVEPLANSIIQMMGLSENPDVPTNWPQGVSKSMALEVVHAMNELGILEVRQVPIDESVANSVGFEQLNFIRFNKEEGGNSLQEMRDNLSSMKLARLLTPDSVDLPSFTPIDRVPERQNNSVIRLSDKQKEVINNFNKARYWFNTPLHAFRSKLGKDNMELLKGLDPEIDGLNEIHARSVRGTNLGIQSAEQMTDEFMDFWIQEAKSRGLDVDEVPVYIPHTMDSNSRIRQVGHYTPQNSKAAREMVASTRVTMDLDSNPEDITWFMVSVAQAMGIKTETRPRGDYTQDLVNDLDTPFVHDLVEAINTLESTDNPDASQVSDVVDRINDWMSGNAPVNFSLPRTDRAIHALHTWARYQKAMAENTHDNFTTYLPIELDGKTDGPINAFVHMALHRLNSYMLNQLAQGGIFLNSDIAKTLNQAISDSGGKLGDIYTSVAARLQGLIEKALASNNPLHAHAVMLMDLAGQAEYDDTSSVKVVRNVAKTAVTPKGYAAGANSVINKLVSEQIDAIYKHMSELLANDADMDPEYVEAIHYMTRVPKKILSDRNQYKTFRFNQDDIKTYRKHIKRSVGGFLNSAVDMEMHHVQEAFNTLFTASIIQSGYFSARYRAAYQAERKKLIDKGELRPTDALSRKQERQIIESLAHLAPNIATTFTDPSDPNQGVSALNGSRDGMLMRTSKENENRPVVVAALGGGPRLSISLNDFTSPGVRIAALANISVGDAAMITGIGKTYYDGYLHVYDGFEVPPKDVQKIAEHVNKVVHDNYKFDVLSEAQKTFSRFKPEYIDDLSAKDIIDLAKHLYIDDDLTVPEKRIAIKAVAKDVARELQVAAAQNKAAKDVVFNKSPTAVDHMATGEAAYRPDLPVVPDIVGAVQEAVHGATPLPETAISGAQFKGLLDKQKFKDRVNGSIYKAIRHLIPDDAVIYRGTKEEMEAEFTRNHPGVKFDPENSAWVYGKEAYFVSRSEEVVIHELVHLATQGLINNFYSGNLKGITAAQREAIRNLETMAREFTQMDLGDAGQAAHSQNVVRSLLDSNLPNDAVSEFIAYAVTNPQTRVELSKREPTSAIGKMAKRVIDAVRRMLGLPKNQFTESFMTQVLGEFHRVVRRPLSEVHYFNDSNLVAHSLSNRLNDHLTAMNSVVDRLIAAVPKDGMDRLQTLKARNDALRKGWKVTDEFVEANFDLDNDQQLLFSKIQLVMNSGLPLDAGVMTALSMIHEEAMNQLTVRDFLDNPESTNTEDMALAQARYDALNDAGQSPLANFVALAVVDPVFRSKLDNMKLPKTEKLPEYDGVDSFIRHNTTRAFNRAFTRLAGLKPNQSQKEAVDHLLFRLANLNEKMVNQQKKVGNSLVDRAEATIRKYAEKGDDKIAEATKQMYGKNAGMSIAAFSMDMMRAFVSDKGAKNASRQVLSIINQTDRVKGLRSLVSEIIGTTEESWPIHQLLNQSKEMVATVRQRLRDEAPAQVHSYFSKPLTKEQTKSMFKTVGRTDIQSLYEAVGYDQLAQYVSDGRSLNGAVRRLEKQLEALDPEYVNNAKDLSDLMVHGEAVNGHGKLLYLNAQSIASQAGQNRNIPQKKVEAATPLIDQLTSLYALSKLDKVERETLKDLLTNERSGMESIMTLLNYLVKTENQKTGAHDQRYNSMKGYIPSSRDPRYGLITGKASEIKKYRELGYEAVGMAEMDPNDPSTPLMLFAAKGHAGQASYNQGVMQTVDSTTNGVNMLTGEMVGPMAGTAIHVPQVVRSITKNKISKAAAHKMRPVFNNNGDIVGYERLYSPRELEQHTRGREDITQSIGMWLGRQAEESIAQTVNKQVIKVMKADWDKSKHLQADEFVDISKPKNNIERDAWNSIPEETRRELFEQFGDDGIMVRRNMVDNTIGYRTPSVADVFTDLSNLPEPIKQGVRNVALATLGPNAYRYLVLSERGVQGAVSLAKNIIIVRSGVVAVANALSNVLQLMAEGVPLLQIPKILAKKGAETEIYLRNGKRIAQLRLDLESDSNPANRINKEREIKRLENQLKKLTIWPLLENGELPSIVEGLTESDDYTILNDVSSWLKSKTEQLPDGLSTFAKYAVISKDTALYQGLNRMIQLGDFTAKAAVYDRKIAEGMSKDQALRYVSETFVNYNLLPGRSRTYLEGMGMTWFMNYKLRMQKIILRNMRNNPVRFLGSIGAGSQTGIDSMWDTFAPNANWKYGTGYGQLFSAPEMTAWKQISDSVD